MVENDFSAKKSKTHKLCLIMLATNTIFIDRVRINLTKFHEKFQLDTLKFFRGKIEKMQKRINYA